MVIGAENALYEIAEKKICYSDFVDALYTVGIEKGDTIFVHSDIAVFGKLATHDRKFLFDSLINAMKEVVGDKGNIIMPTFTYSFCKKEIFDVDNTPSTVGALTDYFRKLPDVQRSVHPIFSVAVWGRDRESLCNISKDSFGEDSIFDKLYKHKGKIVCFGAPFLSITYIHYVEQKHGIPYRFIKKFKGIIKNKDRSYEEEVGYFVRPLDKNIEIDANKLEEYFLSNNFLKKTRVGSGLISLIDIKDYCDVGSKLLDKDVFYFLVSNHEFK